MRKKEEEKMKIEERAFWVRRDAEEYVAEVHKQTGTTMIIHVSKIGAFYRVKEKKRNWEKERV